MPRYITVRAQIGRHDNDPEEKYVVYQDGREVYSAANQAAAIAEASKLVEIQYPRLIFLTVVREVTLATITCEVSEETLDA